VAGDILPLAESFPPSRCDEHGFPGSGPGQAQVKSGMTEWGRTNPDIAATSRSPADNLPHLCSA
jgi:hypothetical protein